MPATSVVVVAIEFVVASAVDQPDILKYVSNFNRTIVNFYIRRKLDIIQCYT